VDFYEETGVQGRMLFDVGGGEVDIKAKYSKIDAGAYVYFSFLLPFARVAGVEHNLDWTVGGLAGEDLK